MLVSVASYDASVVLPGYTPCPGPQPLGLPAVMFLYLACPRAVFVRNPTRHALAISRVPASSFCRVCPLVVLPMFPESARMSATAPLAPARCSDGSAASGISVGMSALLLYAVLPGTASLRPAHIRHPRACRSTARHLPHAPRMLPGCPTDLPLRHVALSAVHAPAL